MKKIVLVFVLALMTSSMWAAEIYSKVTAQTVYNLMLREGYNVSLDKDADIMWKKDGIKMYIFFDDGKVPQSNIQFHCGYKVKDDDENFAEALILSNNFNSKYRFVRSYVKRNENDDESFSVMIKLDLSLSGGITKNRMSDFFEQCLSLCKAWKEEVVDKL